MKYQLDFRGHLLIILKPISNQNLFSRFQSWTAIKKIKSKDQAILEISYVKKSRNLINWENSITRLLKNLKWLNQFAVFTTVYPHEKNQHHASIHSWNPEDLIMGIVFGMPRCVWLHPYEWTESNRCINVCLTTSKNQLYT